jgi:hypothetical protein
MPFATVWESAKFTGGPSSDPSCLTLKKLEFKSAFFGSTSVREAQRYDPADTVNEGAPEKPGVTPSGLQR